MKPDILHRTMLLGTTVVVLCGTAVADTFILKDGRRLEGSILSERDDSYLLEVQVTRSIKDEITIAKDDIDRIEREEPDRVAFTALAELVPVPDLLSEEQYAERIESIRTFIAEFPNSTSIKKAQEMLDTHLAEYEVITAGGIKIGSKLRSPEERIEDAYYIDSRIRESEIRRLVRESGLLRALRAFQAFEADFTGSEAWHSLLPLMRQVVATHQVRTQEMIDAYDDRIARQETGLSRMSLEERQSSMRAIAERDAALKERHDKEKALRGYWLSTNPYYKPALDDTVRFAEQEMRRLETAVGQPLRQPTPSELWRSAVTAIRKGDEAEIKTAMTAVRSARMSERHIEQLQKLTEFPE